MKLLTLSCKILITIILLTLTGCGEIIEEDPCREAKWPLPKTFEIKIAVHISATNPQLSGGSPGSQKPEDFDKMQVSGTIQKFECNEETTGPVNLGNTFLIKGVDYPAPVDTPKSYWIGHVVYVYEFDNDDDYLEVNLNVKITMLDGNSYVCTISDVFDSKQITLVPTEMYYYVLMDVYSDLWIKV